MKITYSAPAKVIFTGEHAVVYGKPALVSAIDLRLNFTVADSSRTSDTKITSPAIEVIAQKVREYLSQKKTNYKNKQFNYSIKSNIPIGRGLGSSAALSVAATAALLELYTHKTFDNMAINNIAYQGEKFFHKNPSGVDVSASCFSGFIYFRKEFEFLKNISSLNFRIPKKIEDNLYLIDSGKPVETTAYMVHDIVGAKYNKSPRLVDEVLNDIEKTTKRMVVSIIKEDVDFFIKSIVDNEIFLEMLGIVSASSKKLLKNLETYGVGKVTGAGGKKKGSGFILFYSHKKNKLESFLKKEKINFTKFKQSFTGVKKEL